MSDGLAQILQSIRTTQQNILGRLASVEQEVRAAGTSEVPAPGRYGYVSPTSPASKSICVHGGLAWYSLLDYDDRNTGQQWPDFVGEPSISAFTNAYYYRWIIVYLQLYYYYIDPYGGQFQIQEGGDEFPTYEDCAKDISQEFITAYQMNIFGPILPLCTIAIRNNGTTGSVNKFYKVTLADRAKSSFIHRDIRPWFKLTYWS